VKYQVSLSGRAAKDLDRLSRDVQDRMLERLDRIAEDPLNGTVDVVTIERRGQVYQRI
jgi:mRNA-degrading endonuclease RelE of RelBE toxin-antitoxin system